MIVDEKYAFMWENNPHIAKLTSLPKDHIPPDMEGWHLWFRKKAKEYDRFYNLSHSCEALVAISPEQTWFQWPASMRRRMCDHNYLEVVHDLCEVRHDFTIGPRFYPTEAETADAIRVKGTVGERCIGIVLSGSRLDKVWPWMPSFVAKLLREVKIPVVLFGGPGRDVELCNRVYSAVEQLNGNVIDLNTCISRDDKKIAVEWSAGRNLTQIQQCDLVITPDTGLAWGVAMSAMPKIVLLSHASSTNITKHWVNTVTLHADQHRVPCWPCHQLHASHDTCVKATKADAAACITDIHDTTVMEHVVRLLEQPKSAVVPWVAHDVLNDASGYVGLRRPDAAD